MTLEVAKRAGEPLGAEVSSAVFDRVRTCDNHCEFCFIYQLPKGLRRSLYLKDDDYRLSFLYGNFTTLTRFTEADLERVVTERLSPLHVSIHATDPDVRSRMLKNPRGAHEPALAAGAARPRHRRARPGRAVPRRQRRRVFDRTMAGVLDEYPELESVAVVPLGLSRVQHRVVDARAHARGGASDRRRRSTTGSRSSCASLGRRMVFAADEYYLMAGRPFPAAESYEGFSMHEDGIGMARTFELEFNGAASQRHRRRRAGFFAAVDGAPATDTARRATPPATPACAAAAPHDGTPFRLGARRRMHRSESSPASSAPDHRPLIDDARPRRRPRGARSPTSSSVATPRSPD